MDGDEDGQDFGFVGMTNNSIRLTAFRGGFLLNK